MDTSIGFELIFDEVMQDSPLGREKLKRLWKDLNIETQMQILAELLDRDMSLTPKQLEIIYPLSHSVVQQIAIRHTRLDTENEWLDASLHESIFNNLDPFVSNSRWSCKYLDQSNRVDSYEEEFVGRSYYHKLAILEGPNAPDGKEFAKCIQSLMEAGEDDSHIRDFVEQYTWNEKAIAPHLHEAYVEGVESYYLQCYESLWMLTASLPIELGRLLARKLPVEVSSEYAVSQDFFEGLNSELLAVVLSRADIELIELRRKILFDVEFSQDSVLLSASVYYNFHCTDQELAELFHNIKSEKDVHFSRLLFLTYADYLTPQQIKAIGWYFTTNTANPDDWPVSDAQTNLVRIVTQQVEDDFDEYYKSSDDLDLLDLLFDQINWDGGASNMMKFLKPLTEQFDIQNPWDLYIAVKEAMPSKSADELCREAAFDDVKSRFSRRPLIGTNNKMPLSKYQVYRLFCVEELSAEEAFELVIDELETYPEREKVLFDQLIDEVQGGIKRFVKLHQYHEMVDLLLGWHRDKYNKR